LTLVRLSRFSRRSRRFDRGASLLSVRIHDLATGVAELISLLREAGQDATATRLDPLAEFLEIASAGRAFGGCLRHRARR
jgi:hypothetical protein